MSDHRQVVPEILTDLTVERNPTDIDRSPSPSKYIHTHHLPAPASPNFVGREGVLARLHDRLHAQAHPIVAVVGMAGVGKTEVAIQYAHTYRHSYDRGGFVWFGMLDDRYLADVLAWHLKHEFHMELPSQQTLGAASVSEHRRELAQWCWQQWEQNLPADAKVLVVLDNVEEPGQIAGMLPSNSRFQILVTTRIYALDPSILEEPLEELTDAAAVELLRKSIADVRIDRELRQTQQLCCDSIGNLPLGIELAGGYLHQDDELTIAEFTRELSIVQEALDAADPLAVYPTMTAERGVKSLLELSWQQLAPESQTLAKLLGLCAPTGIPWELATKMVQSAIVAEARAQKMANATNGIEQLTKNLGNLWKWKAKAKTTEAGASKTLTVKEMRQQLLDLHLLKWDKQRETVTLHPLVRNFCHDRSSTPDILTQIFAETMLQRARQAERDMNLERVAAMADIVPHIEEVALYYAHLLSERNFDWPFIGVARFYHSQELSAAAEQWYVKCLETAEQRLGHHHPSIALSLNNLAALYESIGNYTAALPLHQRALQIRQEQLGANHHSTALSLNNLAQLYSSIGNYIAARPLYERALQIYEELLGAHHPSTATSLNNLAQLYSSIGNYTAALPLYRRALQIRQEQLGAHHPSTITTLNNLAQLYNSIERSKEAEILETKAGL